MDQLSVMMSTPLPSEFTAAQQSSYVTYTLSSLSSSSPVSPESRNIPPTITLLESASLLAGAGTTGLRTVSEAIAFSTSTYTPVLYQLPVFIPSLHFECTLQDTRSTPCFHIVYVSEHILTPSNDNLRPPPLSYRLHPKPLTY
jgi:hypothetical protein